MSNISRDIFPLAQRYSNGFCRAHGLNCIGGIPESDVKFRFGFRAESEGSELTLVQVQKWSFALEKTPDLELDFGISRLDRRPKHRDYLRVGQR